MQSTTPTVETPQAVDEIIDGFISEACSVLMQISVMPNVQFQNDARAAAIRCFDGHRLPFDRARGAVMNTAREFISEDPQAVRSWEYITTR